MRFTDFSMPESTEWMEKSDILFMLDFNNGQAPFINSSIMVNSGKRGMDLISTRIHPGDLLEFNNILRGRSLKPFNYKIRILDKNNQILSFRCHKLKVNGKQNKELVLGILSMVNEKHIMFGSMQES